MSGRKLKFDEVMGYFNGVPAYSSDYKTANPDKYRSRSDYRAHSHDGIYLGMAHQCVCYSRKFLVDSFDFTYQDVGMAYEIFEISHFQKIIGRQKANTATSASGGGGGRSKELPRELKAQLIPTLRCENGKKPSFSHSNPHHNHLSSSSSSSSPPLNITIPPVGFLLIWYPSGWFRHTGHVAIVSAVINYGNNKFGVRVAEQNVHDCSWEGKDYSRELPAVFDEKEGTFTISETYRNSSVIGWIGTQETVLQQQQQTVAVSAATSVSQQQQKFDVVPATKAQAQQQVQQQQEQQQQLAK